MDVYWANPGLLIDNTGLFQNHKSKSILIMQYFKINIQNQESHSIFQYQELISTLEDCMSKSISRIKTNGEPRILTCTIAFFEKKNKGKVPLNFQPDQARF